MGLIAGAASRVINAEIGDELSGQLHRRFIREIRDDLEANIVYLSDNRTQVLIIGVDLIGLWDEAWLRKTCHLLSKATGVPERQILICSSHTHAGPVAAQLLHDGPTNTRYLEMFREQVKDGCLAAVNGAKPARAGSGLGSARAGYNRRMCWADGSHSMYGDATRKDFVGVEGPDDTDHGVLAIVDQNQVPIAILHNNNCHMTCTESGDIQSSDFAGEARLQVRRGLEMANLPVVYLQGASGDTSPWIMTPKTVRYDGEQRLREIGMTLAGETLRLFRKMVFSHDLKLAHAMTELSIRVRVPTAEQVAEAERLRDMGVEAAGRRDYVLKSTGILRLREMFPGKSPRDVLPLHVVQVGDWAMVTNPCELYCHFGLEIKRRSPAKITVVAQLTDGFSGYVPTYGAYMGGGYSAETTWWTRLEPGAGYQIVDASSKLLREL